MTFNLLKLHMQLHDNPFPDKDDRVMEICNSIINDNNHHIIVAEEDSTLNFCEQAGYENDW